MPPPSPVLSPDMRLDRDFRIGPPGVRAAALLRVERAPCANMMGDPGLTPSAPPKARTSPEMAKPASPARERRRVAREERDWRREKVAVVTERVVGSGLAGALRGSAGTRGGTPRMRL